MGARLKCRTSVCRATSTIDKQPDKDPTIRWCLMLEDGGTSADSPGSPPESENSLAHHFMDVMASPSRQIEGTSEFVKGG